MTAGTARTNTLRAVIWVSLDSHVKETAEKHRGKGSYDPAMNCIRKLAKVSGRKAKLTCNFYHRLAVDALWHDTMIPVQKITEARTAFQEKMATALAEKQAHAAS